MAVLDVVLETLPQSGLTLEAYDRAGRVARRVTGTELLLAAERFRHALRGWDVDGRKVICLLFKPEETIEFLVATLAAMAERWTVVPLYPNWSEATQRQYLAAYRLGAVIAGGGLRGRAERWLLTPRGGDEGGDVADTLISRVLTLSLEELLAETDGGGASGEGEDVAALGASSTGGSLLAGLPPDHPCAWIFTSGTSGRLAKLTEISLGNIDAAVDNIRDIDFLYQGMTLHSPLSTSHVFAFVVILGLLAVKPKRLLFSDVQYLSRLPEAVTGKVNGMILVPIVLNRMRSGFYDRLTSDLDPKTAPEPLRRLARIPLRVRRRLKRVVQQAEDAVIDREQGRHIGLRRRGAILTARRLFGRLFRGRLGSPEFVVIGGAKPNLKAMAFMEVMGIRCLQGWGMTETTGPLAVCSIGDRFRGAFGTCGPMFSGSKAYLEDGELIVEGPQIARGYHDPDGSFVEFGGRKSTGDFAEFDAAGRLRVLGKASDRITTENGLNYNPIPFEEEMQTIDLERANRFEEIVVIGEGQPRLGAVFFTRPVEGSDAARGDERELHEYAASCVRDFNEKRPVDERVERWVISPVGFKEAEVLGPSGKLIRRRVEERYGDIFDSSVQLTEGAPQAMGSP